MSHEESSLLIIFFSIAVIAFRKTTNECRKKVYFVFDSTDTRRQGYAQKVSHEQFSKHHASSTILHVDADRPIRWLESNSI